MNGNSQAGVSWFPRTIKNGKRYSSARAFLGAGQSLNSLTVLTLAKVVQVEIENSKAVAVTVDVKGQSVTFNASKEIILSGGAVYICSANYRDAPEIRINYLESEEDQQLAVAAFKKGREILAQPALRNVVGAEFAPGAEISTDAQLLEYIKNTGEPVHHLAGSCKMGSDRMAVVDQRLRVHGVAHLRIADASIMPDLVSGNTHATCVMIAEKCAAFILQENAC